MEFSVLLFVIASLVTCTWGQTTTAVSVSKLSPVPSFSTYSILFYIVAFLLFSLFLPQKCIVREPLYNATFDLTGLKSTQTFSHPGQGDFTFNMCEGTVPQKCNGMSGTGACFKAAGSKKEVILGYASADAVMTDSTINFDYVGEKCEEDATKNYTLRVIAECDYNIEVDPITLIQVGHESSILKNKTHNYKTCPFQRTNCEFLVRYRTTKACMQTTTKPQCQFDILDQSRTFNLEQLSRGNQRVQYRDSMSFIVSVCRPVIYTATSRCPPDTNICVYDKKKDR